MKSVVPNESFEAFEKEENSSAKNEVRNGPERNVINKMFRAQILRCSFFTLRFTVRYLVYKLCSFSINAISK